MDWTSPATIAHSECLIRSNRTGRRFCIVQAIMRNLLTPAGHPCGPGHDVQHMDLPRLPRPRSLMS
ncbi:MAG: hypothetical protein ACAH89_07105 [Rariglobus sp.]